MLIYTIYIILSFCMFNQYTYSSLLFIRKVNVFYMVINLKVCCYSVHLIIMKKKLGILPDHQFEINLLYLRRLPLVNKSMCFMKWSIYIIKEWYLVNRSMYFTRSSFNPCCYRNGPWSRWRTGHRSHHRRRGQLHLCRSLHHRCLLCSSSISE